MGETPIPDAAARRHALDRARSFIVQAPAGAGKTELLTQRFLVLLAGVERPEEILAITFTKKAAAEMRARVLEALSRAADDTPPDSDHQRRTWELARRARERDIARGWHIEDNPGRLRIQTIDSFCLGLTQQMPLLARFGAPPAIVEDAAELYREAAYATLAMLENNDARAAAIERLFHHLDNDWRRMAELLADMLARRDQWLRHVADRRDPRVQRKLLEAALSNTVRDSLAELVRSAPPELVPEILQCARYASTNLHVLAATSPITACLDIERLPSAEREDRGTWLGLAELLLTSEGSVRSAHGLTRRQGFLAKADGNTAQERHANREAKARMAALLGKVGQFPEFIRRLHAVRGLPPEHYEEAQWQVLETLVDVLPLAAAQLKLVFAAHGRVDFCEIAQGALTALGEPEAPTDLLLALDYRLQHVLVDEFQDTSVSQFALLERITAGWTPGDGRTLFLVGDPMQSIYRFREAEVGLYLRATHSGIGTVSLEQLTLSANFRSQASVVDWVNRSFEQIFPRQEDIGSGAVCYAPCDAMKPALSGDAVTVHPFFDAPLQEAETVAALAQAARAGDSEAKTAILVRNREHLAAIVPELKRAGLLFRAIEIERLAERQIVQDLLALTRALTHLADRTAWLSVLRAPWCGLTLADLHALLEERPDATVWELLADEDRLERLSADGQRRLRGVRPVLATALANRARSPLRRFIEGVWLALGGPACVQNETELTDAEGYFGLLDKTADGSLEPRNIAGQVTRLFAAADVAADDRMQLMTIHKAKGLEFDTVIVPGLGRPPRAEATRLLQWTERARGTAQPDLLLAPVHATGEEHDGISAYLRDLDKARARNEELRLLYVAATRAKQRLHLLGDVRLRAGAGAPTPGAPRAGSLLAALWPVVEPVFREASGRMTVASATVDPLIDWNSVQDLDRLAADWTLPAPPAALPIALAAATVTKDEEVEFTWVGDTARHVGTVVHRWLLRIGDEGLDRWSETRIEGQTPAFRLALAHLGVPADELDKAAAKVVMALASAVTDDRARWLLEQHTDARSEYALTGVLDGRVVNVVLDRTFVDNGGVRWIVDYKTSEHEGADVQAFLDSELARYTAQLERYARLLGKVESRPIRLGLYFPLLRGWREWGNEKG